jgi:hypothetical protein
MKCIEEGQEYVLPNDAVELPRRTKQGSGALASVCGTFIT